MASQKVPTPMGSSPAEAVSHVNAGAGDKPPPYAGEANTVGCVGCWHASAPPYARGANTGPML
jgi:hypothetical protein